MMKHLPFTNFNLSVCIQIALVVPSNLLLSDQTMDLQIEDLTFDTNVLATP